MNNRLTDEMFMRVCYTLARAAAMKGESPFASILVLDNEIIATAHNICVSTHDPTAHAERVLITNVCANKRTVSLKGYTMYTSTEPCSMCSGAIHWSKISRVVFGMSQFALQQHSGGNKKLSCKEILSLGGKKTEVVGPLLEEEGIQVFKDFPELSLQKLHNKYWLNKEF